MQMCICPAQKHDVIICKFNSAAAEAHADFVIKSQQELVHKFSPVVKDQYIMEAIAIDFCISLLSICFCMP